ncbi:MAG: class I SAM-dependent methyltransferase [Candidatus Hydrogenedentes bacterium]|nr:class I SAM-dependent methyltransferase [Candidatus Hydrogenedentota bacterium]
MALAKDIKAAFHMAFAPIRGETHADRLDSFYRAQASVYDDSRKKLLHGRDALYQRLPKPDGGVWIEMGGGTGENLERIGERIRALRSVYVVDLSESLLEVARERIERNKWTNVHTVREDAASFAPPEGRADVVTFSYSLTMIPDWFAAIDHAVALLSPGGALGAVDFYVARKYPAAGLASHSRFTRHVWPAWFGMDNVYLSPDHLPYLRRKLISLTCIEQRARIGYLFGLRVPHYVFIGRKP